MTDFENPRAHVDTALEKTLLGRKSGVAHEQHAEIAIGEHDDHGVLVDVVLAVGEEGAARRDHRDGHAVVARPAVTASCDVNRNVAERGLADAGLECSATVQLAATAMARPEARAEPARIADVVAVGNLSHYQHACLRRSAMCSACLLDEVDQSV
jgi:hypothetical protein